MTVTKTKQKKKGADKGYTKKNEITKRDVTDG